MAIKVGFSSMACPEWDLGRIVERAAALGYDGFELRGLRGRNHLPSVPELAGDPGAVKTRLADAGVELVCLASLVHLETASAQLAEENHRELTETIELASKLGCPYVRVILGNAVGGEHRGTLTRVVAQLRRVAPVATRHGTTILVENGGDFTASEDLWFTVEGVSHPALRGSWNPLAGRLGGERPTRSVPRLGRKIDVFRMADGRFDEAGLFLAHELPGAGDVGLDRAIELLKGVCFQGWLMFEWPQAAADLPEPDQVLPKVLEYVRGRLADQQPVLSAYKGDKKPAKFNAPLSVEPVATTEATSDK
jgi:fatty-acyl-CoA synthase